MMTAATARFEARTTPEVLAMIKRAAEIQGRTLSDFVVSVTYEAAQRAVKEAEIIPLSYEGQMRLAKLLLSPPAEPNEALKRAAQRYQELTGKK